MNKPKKEQLISTAFPAQAAMDNYNRVFTPFPGITRFEYIVLQLYKSDVDTLEECMLLAERFINAIDNHLKNYDHEEATIIQ